MKNRYIVSSFMALAMLCSCVPDHRDFNMPDSSVYFSDNVANNGVQAVLMYDVQSEVETTVYVHSAGLNAATSKVTATVAEDYIEYYNKVNYTELKALPEDCYTLTQSTDEIEGRTASFTVNFNVANIVDFANEDGVDLSDYVLSLRLASDNLPIATVKDTTSLGYYLVRPDLRSATLKIASSGMSQDGNMTITAELPFENSWDLTYDVEFCAEIDDRFTTKGNTIPAKYVFADNFPKGTVVKNETVKSMAPGTNKVEYVITVPADAMKWTKGQASNYAVKFSNAKLNGKVIPIENPVLTVIVDNNLAFETANADTQLGTVLAEYGLTPLDDKQGGGRTGSRLETIVPDGGFIFHPQTSQNVEQGRSYSIIGAFDDKTSNNRDAWMQNWGGETGYGPTNYSIPFWMLVDMQSVQNVGGIEYWTRPDRYNMKTIEFYALDDCTYTLNESVLNYDAEDVTYLGRLTFTRGGTVASITLDPIKTRYIMMNVTELAGNGLDCQELVIWGF